MHVWTLLAWRRWLWPGTRVTEPIAWGGEGGHHHKPTWRPDRCGQVVWRPHRLVPPIPCAVRMPCRHLARHEGVGR